MRHCCCCGVKTAAIILGALNLLGSVLLLFPLSTYLADTDVPNINPIKHNEKYLEIVAEDILREHNWTAHNYHTIMQFSRDWFPTAALIAASLVAVSATASLLLILGVRCQVRSLMVPFLVLTMLDIVVSGALGVIVVVALFYANIIPGIVSMAVYIIIAALSLYSWAAVLAAYKELGPTEYIYTPVSKPADYYPSAPQHFNMGDMGDYRKMNKQERFG